MLPDGSHSLSIYWIGQKYTYATSNRINVDAFDVLGTITDASASPPAPIEWRYEQSDALLTQFGTWGTTGSYYASGGSYLATGQPNGAVVASFSGTSCKVLATKGSGMGLMELTLDGEAPVTVDLYNPTTLHKQVVHTWAGLSPTGAHTVRVRCLGTPSLGRTGTAVTLDALDITGWLTPAPTATRVEQDDAHFHWAGAWAPSTTSYASAAASLR